VNAAVLPSKKSDGQLPNMSKFGCTCGNTISDVQCPNEVTGYLLSDKSGEEFFNLICSTIDDYMQHRAANDVDGWRRKHFNEHYPAVESAGNMIHDVLTSAFFELSLAAMECDKCGRLWFQTRPDVNLYRGYSVDQPDAPVKMLGYNRSDPNAGNTTEMAEPSDAPKSPVGRDFES
jgi:hypothetical protein